MKSFLLILLFVSSIFLPGRAQEDAAPLPWSDRVFYEIFVRSFYDSDGDGIGDLRGVIEKLDYLNDGDPGTMMDLGVTGLWLMPVMQSPSYHGYDVTDYFQIEEDYGTNEDFLALIDAAHARGIVVIVDLVVNHTSVQHPWFVASAEGDPDYADWYIWSDDAPNYRGPWGQTVWIPRGGRSYYAVFWDGMPDLNYNNAEVTQGMHDIARYWLEDMGVDGFRLDAIKHLIEEGSDQENTPSSHAWMQSFHGFIDSVDPDTLTVGEAWSTSYEAADYVENDEVDLVFEFDLAAATVQSARQGNRASVAAIQERTSSLYPQERYGTFLTNHDQNRIMSELGGDMGAAKVAASLLLTAPGLPFIYYGEEIGMEGQKPDERIRTPMQWDATADTAGFTTGRAWEPLSTGNADGINVADQSDDPDSLWSHYRNLIHVRSGYAALQWGEFAIVESDARAIYSFLRYTDDETLLVMINLSDEPVDEYTLILDTGPLADVSTGSVVFGEGTASIPTLNADGGFDAYAPLPSLPPYSTTIIQLS